MGMSIASISVWGSYQDKRAEHDITSDAVAVAPDPVDLVGAELLPVPAPHCDTVVAQSPDVEALRASDTVPVAPDRVVLVCAPLTAMPSSKGDDLIVSDVPTASRHGCAELRRLLGHCGLVVRRFGLLGGGAGRLSFCPFADL